MSRTILMDKAEEVVVNLGYSFIKLQSVELQLYKIEICFVELQPPRLIQHEMLKKPVTYMVYSIITVHKLEGIEMLMRGGGSLKMSKIEFHNLWKAPNRFTNHCLQLIGFFNSKPGSNFYPSFVCHPKNSNFKVCFIFNFCQVSLNKVEIVS